MGVRPLHEGKARPLLHMMKLQGCLNRADEPSKTENINYSRTNVSNRP